MRLRQALSACDGVCGTRPSGFDGVRYSSCCVINSSTNNIGPVITDLLGAICIPY